MKYFITSVLVLIGFQSIAQFKDIDPYPSFDVGNLMQAMITKPDEIYINLYGNYSGKILPTILKTNDSSCSWHFVNFGADTMSGTLLHLLGDTFLMYNGSFGLFLSTDACITFQKIFDFPKNAGINRSPFFANEFIYETYSYSAVYDTVGVYRSNDYCKTWEKVCDTPIQNMSFINKSIGYGIGYIGKEETKRIFKTTDGGNSWFDLHHQNDTGGGYQFISNEHFYKGNSEGLMRSDDEGKTWKTASNDLPHYSLSIYAKFLSAKVGITFSGSYGFFRTVDAGESWVKITDFYKPTVSYINTLLQDGKVYVIVYQSNSAKSGIIYGAFDSTTIFTNSIAEPLRQTQYKVYPNPSKDKITISYTGFVSADTKIRLYDVQGKLLIEQNLTFSETIIELDGLSKGVYILKIATTMGDFVERVVKQ